MIERMQRMEDRINYAAKKTHEHALRSYVMTLMRVPYQNYNETIPGANCSICQQEFQPDDEIVIFECDPKHYFHNTPLQKCGADWLETKPNCPLCQTNFEDKIMKHAITRNNGLMKKISSSQQNPQDIVIEPNSPDPQELVRIGSIEAQNQIRNALAEITEMEQHIESRMPQVLAPNASDADADQFIQSVSVNSVAVGQANEQRPSVVVAPPPMINGRIFRPNDQNEI